MILEGTRVVFLNAPKEEINILGYNCRFTKREFRSNVRSNDSIIANTLACASKTEKRFVEHVPITSRKLLSMYRSICSRNLRSSYTTDLSTKSNSIASDRCFSYSIPSSKRLFPVNCRFFRFSFSLSSSFSFFPPFSILQCITHLTGFYFVCVFPCYLPCRRQMGTKSRQRKVIFFNFHVFHARLPAESVLFLSFFFFVNVHVGMLTRSFFSEWYLHNPRVLTVCLITRSENIFVNVFTAAGNKILIDILFSTLYSRDILEMILGRSEDLEMSSDRLRMFLGSLCYME